MKIHPVARVFPLLSKQALAELSEDIKAHGLKEPIKIWGTDGPVVDGRNRLKACKLVGVEPRYEVVDPRDHDDDPVAYVVSLNLHRRHLSTSQRAMVAAEIATLTQGARTDLAPMGGMSQSQAAGLLNVGKRSVQRAATVRKAGAPELAKAVAAGEVPVRKAAEITQRTNDHEEQVKLMNEPAHRPPTTAAETRCRSWRWRSWLQLSESAVVRKSQT